MLSRRLGRVHRGEIRIFIGRITRISASKVATEIFVTILVLALYGARGRILMSHLRGQNEVCRLKTTIMIAAITATADLETGQAQEQCHTGLAKMGAHRQADGAQEEIGKKPKKQIGIQTDAF